MSRRLPAGLLAVLALAVGACAGGASPTTITRSNAAAVARAVNLRASDLPSYTVKAPQSTPQDPGAGAVLLKCLPGAAQRSKPIGQFSSPDFAGPGLEGTPAVHSTVAVYPSATLLRRRIKVVLGTLTATCLGKALERYLRDELPKKITFALHTMTLPPTVHDGYGAFGFRFAVVVSAKPGATEATANRTASANSLLVYVDLIGLQYRQILIGLIVETFDVPPRLSLEQHLSKLLLARAHSAIG